MLLTNFNHSELTQTFHLSVIPVGNPGARYFRSLKTELVLSPVYHQKEDRVTGHLFITLLAYHLVHTLRYLNLTVSAKEKAQWVSYRLLFVKGTTGDDTEIPGKHDWALFLTTDTSMEPSQILEIYALRWGIEVYFKESKRHPGLLKEQTNSFASHIASTHLAAIRFCMWIYTKQEGTGLTASTVRNQVVDGLVNLSFAKQLWMLFRALIYNGLTGIKQQLGCSVEQVMDAIDEYINYFFVQALQLDPFTLEQEALNQEEL